MGGGIREPMAQPRHDIPVVANATLAAGLAAVNLIQLAALPALLLPVSPHWGWLLAPIVLTTPALWALIHEAVHGLLHPRAAANLAFGRGLSILFGAPFRALRFGHLMHHRFNRTALDRTEVVAGGRSTARTTAVYYARLLGGLYLAEALAGWAAWLPRPMAMAAVRAAFGGETPDGRSMRPAAERRLLGPAGRRELRVDGLAVILLFAGGFALYGQFWWMLALALAGRAVLISFLDNAYHYATPVDDVLYAHDLRLPGPLALAMLNFNLHGVHHHHPALPWNGLARAFAADGHAYEGALPSIALRQLRGPLAVEAVAGRPVVMEPSSPRHQSFLCLASGHPSSDTELTLGGKFVPTRITGKTG